ncbi:MAG TPA: sugar ABC transporter permease [Spirochaetia bacterium]|nr:sugar ABC transporter permease [Spirochaetia bacterium]
MSRKKGLLYQVVTSWPSYVLVLPALAILFVFDIYPIIMTLIMSTRFYKNVFDSVYVGLGNYQYVLTDSSFWNAMKVTGIYTLFLVPGLLVFSLLLAVLLNVRTPLRSLFKAIYYIPVICSGILVGVVWKWIYHGQYGVLNYALSWFGAKPRVWLADTRTALGALIVVGLWKSVGYYMIIYLAGLQSIPAELYESATIDGASKIQSFFRVTLPMLSPILLTVLILATIGSFQAFDQVYVMTYGGPVESTSTIVWRMYYTAFIKVQPGEGAAISFLAFLVIMAVSLLQIRYFRSGLLGSDVK